MTMKSRTPYEVRLDTLCLARDILSENAHAQRDTDREVRKIVAGGGEIVDVDDSSNHPLPMIDDHTYTVDDVIEHAKKLYEFIAPVGEGS